MGLTFKTEIVFRFCASRSQSPCLFWGGDLEWKGACTDGVSTVWGSWKVRYRPVIENLIKYAVLFVKVDHSGLILMGMIWGGKVHYMMLFQMSGGYGKAKYRDDLKNVVLFYKNSSQ